MRGVGAELESDLVSGQSKVGEEVANLLLAGVDNLPGGCLVDSGGNISAELLEADAELLVEGIRRHRGVAGHWLLLSTRANWQLLQHATGQPSHT